MAPSNILAAGTSDPYCTDHSAKCFTVSTQFMVPFNKCS